MAAAAGDDNLPPGWTRLVAPSGQVYYEDSLRNITQLVHPLTEPLPVGWRMKLDARGRPYYLNDVDSTTHWDHPCKRPGQARGGGGDGGGAAPAAPSVPPAWEVMVDGGNWYPFPPETNHLVALAAAKGVTRVSIGSCRVVDLLAMEQLRTDTGRIRKIRQIAGDDPMVQASAAAAAPVAGQELEWEVKTDQGWQRYDLTSEAALTRAYRVGASCISIVGHMGNPYLISLARMLQWREDIPGGHPRAVRAWLGSARDASSRVPPLLSTVFRWQVQTDRGWMEYEPVVADAITLAHNQGRPSVHVTVRRHLAYVVDLVKLTQTPFAGGKTRPIRGPFPSGG